VLLLLPIVGCVGLAPTAKPPEAAADRLGDVRVGALAMDFGPVPVGDEAESVLTLTSSSTEMVTVRALLEGDAAFSVPVDTLAVFEGDTLLTVRFRPTATGAVSGTLRLSDDAGATVDVALLGNGDSGGGGGGGGGEGDSAPNVSLNATSYDFGELEIGRSVTESFTLTNNGGSPLTLSGITPSDGAFRIGGIAANATLAPGASGTVDVTFAPTRSEAYSGTISIASNDPDGAATIAVRGRGAQTCSLCEPVIEVDTDSLEFTVFGSSDRKTVIVRNDGDVDLRVTDVSVANDLVATCGTFSVSGWSGPRVVAPSGSMSLTVTYTITDNCFDYPFPDLDSNMMHILSNDPYTPDWAISLQGSGVYF